MPNYKEERSGADASAQKQSGPHYKTHEELVAAFSAGITAAEARLTLRKPVPAWDWIRRDLYNKLQNSPYKSEKERVFSTLVNTWELLIYDRFLEPGSADENIAGIKISDAYQVNPTIRLNDTQVRMIDALTEVAGIPRAKGQNELPIPEKFADLDRLRSSPEYQRRAAEHAERTAKWVAAQRRR